MASPAPELPPAGVLMQLLSGSLVAQAISVAAELQLADHLSQEPRSAADVAPAVAAQAPALYRLMRALAMVGVLVEHEGERFTLTPVGECLRSDAPGSQRALATMLGRPWRLAAVAQLSHGVRTGEPVFPRVFGKGVFEWFGEHPEEGAIFNDAMTSGSATVAEGVARALDLAGCSRIAEVGGGHGTLLAAILKANPQVRGVLFDLPAVVEGARKVLEGAGVAERCERVGGDFFQAVPTGCDAYVMKHIIHDWDDPRAIAILGRCREAMSASGKVVVVETVVPPRGVPHFAKLLDLQMMATTDGGRERTEREFADLFARAGLRLTRVVPTPIRVSLVEAVRA